MTAPLEGRIAGADGQPWPVGQRGLVACQLATLAASSPDWLSDRLAAPTPRCLLRFVLFRSRRGRVGWRSLRRERRSDVRLLVRL